MSGKQVLNSLQRCIIDKVYRTDTYTVSDNTQFSTAAVRSFICSLYITTSTFWGMWHVCPMRILASTYQFNRQLEYINENQQNNNKAKLFIIIIIIKFYINVQLTIIIPVTKELNDLSRSDGKRPDGLSLILWQEGKPLCWDLTVICPLANSYLQSATASGKPFFCFNAFLFCYLGLILFCYITVLCWTTAWNIICSILSQLFNFFLTLVLMRN